MSNDESSKNENNSNFEEDESLEKKKQNLLQVNEIEDEKRIEIMNSLLKKRKKNLNLKMQISNQKKKKIINGYCKIPKEFGKKNCDIREIKDEEESLKDIKKENIFDPDAFIMKV